MNSDFRIVSSPITAFTSEEMKKLIRSLFKTGRLSNQTAIELIGEVDFKTEVGRIKKERDEGIEEILSPWLTENIEGKGTNDNLPDDKTDPGEKREYKIAKSNVVKIIKKKYIEKTEICPHCNEEIREKSLFYDEKKEQWFHRPCIDKGEIKFSSKKGDLVTAPYKTVSELPSDIKKLSLKLQRTFMKAWNRAYYFQIGKGRSKKFAEQYAFRVARSQIKKRK